MRNTNTKWACTKNKQVLFSLHLALFICSIIEKNNKCVLYIKAIVIRTFGDNFAHAWVKGHDCENGEYLNSK